MLLRPEIQIQADYINFLSKDILWFKIYNKYNHIVQLDNWLTTSQNDTYYGNIKIEFRGNQYKLLFVMPCETNHILLSSNHKIIYYNIYLDNPIDYTIKIETNIGDFYIITIALNRHSFECSSESLFFNKEYTYGYDIVNEHELFIENLYTNINNPNFKYPLIVSLKNNMFFNGLGSYLYDNVLYYLDDNPFQTLDFLLKKENEKTTNFFNICKTVPQIAYDLGGRQNHIWQNPFHVNSDKFMEWNKAKKDLYICVDNHYYYFNYKWAHCCPFELNKSQQKKLKILKEEYRLSQLDL